MYLIYLKQDLTIEAISKNFKALLKDELQSLKKCFFLSMVDSEVPDQLVEDLYDSLDKGLIYSTSIKINVIKTPKWFEVSIAPRFQEGKNVGFQASLKELSEDEITTTTRVYNKIAHGEMSMKQGWPVQNNHLEMISCNAQHWDTRIK